MYGHAQPMNQIVAAGGDDDDAASVGAESIDNPHIRYDAQHPLEDAGGTVGAAGVVDDVAADSVYVPGGVGSSELPLHRSDDANQLTLSFRGQVYVFDAVTPDKVRTL